MEPMNTHAPRPAQLTDEEIDNRFDYHAPDEAAREKHEAVRAACKRLAHRLNGLLPDGRDKAVAFTHLEQAMYAANAAIARHKDD